MALTHCTKGSSSLIHRYSCVGCRDRNERYQSMNGDVLCGARIEKDVLRLVTYGGIERATRLYKVYLKDNEIFFECDLNFIENKKDFTATIRNFGLTRPQSAGSSTRSVQMSFDKDDILCARVLIEDYFFGDPGLKEFPRNILGCQCLEIFYGLDWISERGGSSVGSSSVKNAKLGVV